MIDKLRDKLTATVAANHEPAEAEEEPAVAATDDPMNALDDVTASPAPQNRGSRYKSKRKKKRVTEIEMPCREPTKHPTATSKRMVRLYPASTTTVYISERDLNWFLDWVWDELSTGGVVALEVAEERKLTPPVEFTFFPARRWRERMGSAYMDSSTVHTR